MSRKVPLTEAVSDIEEFWDYAGNNNRSPADFGASGSDKVRTFCPVCRNSVLRSIRFSWYKDDEGVGHVIKCKLCGKQKNDNSLVQCCPDIVGYWDYDRNDKPENYTVSSGRHVYVRCPECGEYQYRAVCDTVKKNDDGSYRFSLCRQCSYKLEYIAMQERKNAVTESLVDSCPDIVNYWDYDSNRYTPHELTRISKEQVYCYCPSCNERILRRAINTLVMKDGRWTVSLCQKCAAIKTATELALDRSGSLVESCPEIVGWWDYDANDVSPEVISRGSHYKVHLKCPACSTAYHRDLHSLIIKHKDGRHYPAQCRECGYSDKGNPEDNLLTVCPDIVRWWNYDKNSPFKPEQFTKGSSFKAYMTCPDCGTELYSDIHSMLKTLEDGTVVVRHEGLCRKLREQNIVKLYPEVLDWWDKVKNLPDNPEDFTVGSQHRAYFRCPDCGTETYRKICSAFALKDNGIPFLFECPYCNNKKVSRGVNSFKASYPELMKEWLEAENIIAGVDADDNLPGSFQDAWWQCPICQYKYLMSFADRTMKNKRGHNPCPYCNGRRQMRSYFI